MLRVLAAASGSLGFQVLNEILNEVELVGLLTDGSSRELIKLANDLKIPVLIGNPRGGRFADALARLSNVDVLFSISYLFLIQSDIIQIPRIAALNIHGGMLPKYRGRAPHIWAIINGEESVGITIHKIDEGCDTGAILLQRQVPVLSITTGGDLIETFKQVYPQMIRQALTLAENGSLDFREQNHQDSTYFGKRTPEDGKIDWSWEKKRVLNWIRALTRPYPGAFCEVDKATLFIWKAEEYLDEPSNLSSQVGAMIQLADKSMLVRVANGVVRLVDFEFGKKV